MGTRMGPVLLMALAVVVSSVTIAQAGGGGAGIGDNPIFFNCYFVKHGGGPARVLEVNDQFGNPDSVVPGHLKMLCTPANATVTAGELTTSVLFPDHLSCYEVPGSGIEANAAVVEVSDSFGTQTVKVVNSKFVCLGATAVCQTEGCPVLGP
jgi:hypothetical protein